jgi:hypothetical protein
MDEHGGHEDLPSSGRQIVIPYVHVRTEVVLLKPALPDPFLFSPTSMKRCLPGPFIAQGRVVIMRPGARQVAPRWLKLYTIFSALMARSN